MELGYDSFSSLSEAIGFFLPLSFHGCHKLNVVDPYGGSVFWGHTAHGKPFSYWSVEERIKRVLIKSEIPYYLIQFWALEKMAGSTYLTTRHQPFYIDGLDKGICSYRKECMEKDINVGSEGHEAQLGPPGRAFRSGFIEFSPNIHLYTIQEFPLRDRAILCGATIAVSIPVFEHEADNIVGVLEFLSPLEGASFLPFRELATHLKEMSLRMDGTYSRFEEEYSPSDESYFNLVEEINEMFKGVDRTHPLALGYAFEPCFKDECLYCSGRGCLDKQIACHINRHMHRFDEFREVHDVCRIQRGQGVSGMAFASGESCFCRDIRNFSFLDYPLAHCARDAGLTFSVATCVQSIKDKDDIMVLEFFFLPSNYNIEYIRFLMRSLLTKINQHLKSYKVVGEDFPGEEVFPIESDSLKYAQIELEQLSPNSLSFPLTPSCSCDMDDVYDRQQWCSVSYDKAVDLFMPAKLSYKEVGKSIVFWSHKAHDADNHHEFAVNLLSVEERIKLVFERVPINSRNQTDLAQFWVHRMIAGRSLLTTFDQPFAFSKRIACSIANTACLYRKECMGRNIYVDENGNNGQLGPSGRAFKNGEAESSPNVQLYSIEEFPLRDHALLLGIKTVVSLPVFYLDGKDIVGVLEILNRDAWKFDKYLSCLAMELKKMGLRIDYGTLQPGQSESLAGIEKMFKAISETYPLQFATALTPFQREYCHNNSSLQCFKHEASYINPRVIINNSHYFEFLLMALHLHNLQVKSRVAGDVLASSRSHLCLNTSNFSITGYPLAHYAKCCGFTFSFAIGVQSTQINDTPCVLQFFLLPGDYSSKYIFGLLDSLLKKIKQHLPPNYMIMSGDVPRSFIRMGNFIEKYSTLLAEPIAEGEDNRNTNPSTSRMVGNSFHISLDELRLQFGNKLKDAANNLGVGISTPKRIRGSYGIHRWPSHKKNKVNPSLFMKENLNHAPHIGEDATLGSSGTDSAHAVLLNQRSLQFAQGIQTDEHQTVPEVDIFVTIKASYGDGLLLKFRLNHRSRLKDLEQEVAKRLNVPADRCSMKHQDEEGDWVSIIIDEDLQSCLQDLVARGQTTIRMSIHLK